MLKIFRLVHPHFYCPAYVVIFLFTSSSSSFLCTLYIGNFFGVTCPWYFSLKVICFLFSTPSTFISMLGVAPNPNIDYHLSPYFSLIVPFFLLFWLYFPEKIYYFSVLIMISRFLFIYLFLLFPEFLVSISLLFEPILLFLFLPLYFSSSLSSLFFVFPFSIWEIFIFFCRVGVFLSFIFLRDPIAF